MNKLKKTKVKPTNYDTEGNFYSTTIKAYKNQKVMLLISNNYNIIYAKNLFNDKLNDLNNKKNKILRKSAKFKI